MRLPKREFTIELEPLHSRAREPEIRRAAELLRQGHVVAFPTETVYGLGANAFDSAAVVKIFEIKERPRFDPLIVHVADSQAVHCLVQKIPEAATALMARFWPGPLTVVLPKTDLVPDIVTAGLHTVAVRMPAHPVALAVIEAAGVPIAAPSANLFGCISPTCARHVEEQLGERVDMILDGGDCRVGVESTIVSFDQGQPVVLRVGGTPVEDLMDEAGDVVIAAGYEDRPQSPGRLLRHYAPRTPLLLREVGGPPIMSGRVGLLTLQATKWDSQYASVEVLSTNGCLREAATGLFAAMRRLDALKLDGIEAIRVPERGLGRAVNDRLQRAAQKSD